MRLMVTTWETHTPNNLPDSSPKASSRADEERSQEGPKAALTNSNLSKSDFSDEIQEEISSAVDIASLSLSALSADADLQSSTHDYRGAPHSESLLTDENKECSEHSPLLQRRRSNDAGYDALHEV